MASPIDASWNNNVLSDNNLNQTTYGQGTSFPSTWRTDRLFWRSDEKKLYQNNGTEGTPSWSELGGSGTEFKEITTAETFNPEKQTGLTHLVFEKEGVSSGNLKWYIDGVLQDTYTGSTGAGQYNKIIKPTTSLQFVSAAGVWSDTAYSGINTTPTYGISDHHGMDISPDGLFAVRIGDKRLRSTSITTAYDISAGNNLGYDYSVMGSTYVYSCKFGNSGNNLFVGTSGTIYKFNLSSPYEWSGSSIGGTQQTYSSTNGGALGSGQNFGLDFNSDGTKLFTNLSSGGNIIYEHELTTGWDLSTASYSGNSYNTTMSASDMRAFTMSKDGVWLYTTTGSAGSSLLYRHEMSTPYDITTATIDSTSIDISSLLSESSWKLNSQMCVANNDTYLYIAQQGGATDKQYRLELQTNFTGDFKVKIG